LEWQIKGFLKTEVAIVFSLKMLGCFNPTLGQIWTNPNNGLKISLKTVTQWLGLSIFDPKLGLNNPAIFRVYCDVYIQRKRLLKHEKKNLIFFPTELIE